MQSPLDHVLVWDLETIPDLPCVARVNGFDEADEAVAREKLGDKFPKLIYHAIVCIGALIAERVEGVWIVRSLGAPNIADRTIALDLSTVDVIRLARIPECPAEVVETGLPIRRKGGERIAEIESILGVAIEVGSQGEARSRDSIDHRPIPEHRQVKARPVERHQLRAILSDPVNEAPDQFGLGAVSDVRGSEAADDPHTLDALRD